MIKPYSMLYALYAVFNNVSVQVYGDVVPNSSRVIKILLV